MKNRLIQFLPVLLIAFVSFATLGIVQAQNRNPCADTPEAERLLSELTTACSEQSSEKNRKNSSKNGSRKAEPRRYTTQTIS